MIHQIYMLESKLEENDLIGFIELTENHFQFFMKFADSTCHPSMKNKLAIATVDPNIAFEKCIADSGFRS